MGGGKVKYICVYNHLAYYTALKFNNYISNSKRTKYKDINSAQWIRHYNKIIAFEVIHCVQSRENDL